MNAAKIHPSAVVRLFVYGSLLPGQSHYGLIEPYLTGMEAGKVKGRLVDCGPYPALVPGGGGIIRGVWISAKAEAMAALDELEGFIGIEESNDYERVWMRDAERPHLAGWVYVWSETRGCPESDSDWWPDVLARKRNEER